MTAELRPTTLPTVDEAKTLPRVSRDRLVGMLKADKSLHDGEFFECRACALISSLEGRRA